MALLNSLFSGVSGLQSLQQMMDVVGNNISNVDTIGFKSSSVTFSDTFNELIKAGTNPTSTTGGTNSFQIGLGTKINSIDRNWNQGTFQTTNVTTDLALQGTGMFILNSNGTNYYTRAGSFSFDQDGKLVNSSNGAVVQGKVANGAGQIPAGTTLQDIIIDKNLQLPAVKTSSISWGGNLQSSSPTIRTSLVALTGNLDSAYSTGYYSGSATSSATAYSASDPTSYTATNIESENGTQYQLRTWYTQDSTTKAWTANYCIYDSTGTTQVYPATGTQSTALTFDPTTAVCTTNQAAVTQSIPASGSNPADTISFNLDFSNLSNLNANSSAATIVNQGETETPVTGAVTIYDSLGNPYTLSIQFDHVDSNKWSWTASIPSSDGTLSSPASGTINFASDGSIQSIYQGTNLITSTPPIPSITFQPSNGAEAEPLALNFGQGTSGITQTSLTSQVAALSQNGSAASSLTNLNIDQYGNIVGIFSNGNSRTLAQVMVANFNNLNGLVSEGNNMYSVAADTGSPIINSPGETSNTTIQSGALEQSNVDLSQEFANLIVAQNGFEANAKVVTTADTLLQEITNLVR